MQLRLALKHLQLVQHILNRFKSAKILPTSVSRKQMNNEELYITSISRTGTGLVMEKCWPAYAHLMSGWVGRELLKHQVARVFHIGRIQNYSLLK